MTLMEALGKMTTGAASLRSLLALAANNPELRPEAELWLTKLDTAVSADNLAALGALLDMVQGKFEGRQHPSDLA